MVLRIPPSYKPAEFYRFSARQPVKTSLFCLEGKSGISTAVWSIASHFLPRGAWECRWSWHNRIARPQPWSQSPNFLYPPAQWHQQNLRERASLRPASATVTGAPDTERKTACCDETDCSQQQVYICGQVWTGWRNILRCISVVNIILCLVQSSSSRKLQHFCYDQNRRTADCSSLSERNW